MSLYLHETLDPVPRPGAHTRYLAELGDVVRNEGNARGSTGSRCVAAWVPLFVTGRWPQIITFWEIPGGWEGLAAHFDANLALFHEPLERWYGERTGGVDRICIGSGYTQDLDQMLQDGRRAPVVLQETVTLECGGADYYIEQLGRMISPANGGREGFGLLGAYEIAFRDGSEVLLLWAFPDFSALARAQCSPQAFPWLERWRATSRLLEKTHQGVVLRPAAWSPVR